MQAYLKQNKPLLLLPLLLLPFVVLIFYILGGGKNLGEELAAEQVNGIQKGVNYELPDADHKLEIRDKTELVQTSGEIKLSYDFNILGDNGESKVDSSGIVAREEIIVSANDESVAEVELDFNTSDPDGLLKHILRREKQIRTELEAGEKTHAVPAKVRAVSKSPSSGPKSAPKPGTASESTWPTTGMEELNRIFLQNQQLSRQNDSLRLNLQKSEAFQKQVIKERQQSFTLQKGGTSAFKPSSTQYSPLKAEVYQTTTVLSGNRLKLRLLDDAMLNGIQLPAGSFLYGVCEVANERLRISIDHLPTGDSFIPVDINVYDLDGIEGLYVPDNASRKVLKDVGSSTNTSSMVGITGNPLTYAGVQAADRSAQSLLRMIRIKRVTIRKNTQVWLINQSK